MCENMPSGKATKPGDVVRAKNGKTIQVGGPKMKSESFIQLPECDHRLTGFTIIVACRLIIQMQRADWFSLTLSVTDTPSTPEPSSTSPR